MLKRPPHDNSSNFTICWTRKYRMKGFCEFIMFRKKTVFYSMNFVGGGGMQYIMQDVYVSSTQGVINSLPPIHLPTTDPEVLLLILFLCLSSLHSSAFPGTEISLHPLRARALCQVGMHCPLQQMFLEHFHSQRHTKSRLVWFLGTSPPTDVSNCPHQNCIPFLWSLTF